MLVIALIVSGVDLGFAKGGIDMKRNSCTVCEAHSFA